MAVDRHIGCGTGSKLMTPLDVGRRTVSALPQLYELTCYWWSVSGGEGGTWRGQVEDREETEGGSHPFTALPAWLIGLSMWHKIHHQKLISCTNHNHTFSFPLIYMVSNVLQISNFLETLKPLNCHMSSRWPSPYGNLCTLNRSSVESV